MDTRPEACLQRYLKTESLLHHFYTFFDYCSRVCIPKLIAASPGKPVAACCKDRYYQVYDLDHPSFDLLRRERESLYGSPADQPENSGVSPCEYHTATGCLLKDHKSPVCLSFMCRPAIDALREKHGIYTYDYLGFNYALEWILTGDMPEKEWRTFYESLEDMIRKISSKAA
ncbi:hypothetical protein LZ24_02860 [Desulfobotulus alkaliphilus]|uniref:Uncharacterized protein n=1 Tax=Desulfobotulus alkaliphilus TaxID=622671 RepID=A0A562RDD9_9BACT|nr:hypothetical protein [Desulfobotulus alkaliphilus]TWI66903.1 hypothetical protein LZ24_02860 [Desulfobotulus alkaliphilus]